jgi:hypothetical protein
VNLAKEWEGGWKAAYRQSCIFKRQDIKRLMIQEQTTLASAEMAPSQAIVSYYVNWH